MNGTTELWRNSRKTGAARSFLIWREVRAVPCALADPKDWSVSLQIFLYLQALDVFTTWRGLGMGLQEASPVIHALMRLDPLAGLLAGKMVAVVLGGYCVWSRRSRVIVCINCWYTVLVAWNFILISLH